MNRKLKTEYLLDETIACIPVFNKIEKSLMDLETTILEIKVKFTAKEAIKKDIDVEKKIEKDELNAESEVEIMAQKEVEIQIESAGEEKINDVVKKMEKEDSKADVVQEDDCKTNVAINKTDNKVELTDNTDKKLKSIEKFEITNGTIEEKLQEHVAAEETKVPKIIKDAAKVWEGKEALKKAFKARD